MEQARGKFPRLKLVWADGGYSGKLVEWAKDVCGWVLEIVKRNDALARFVVLPRRWFVERTFAWLCRYRRLNENYEELTGSNEVIIIHIHLMLKRLAPATH